MCCVFWFLGPPRALFCSISQHTGQVLRLPLGHPAGTVLRFLVFRPGLGSVSPNIAAHRRLCLSTLTCRHRTTLHPRILTCCRCLILSLPAACHRRRSVCCVFRFLASPWIPFHPISQHTGRVLRLPLGHPAGTVLRFRGIRSAIGLKKPDIAAHRPRRDAAWMEAQVLGADAGARVRGVWRRVEARGSAGKRHIGSGRGAAGMLRGARVRWRKALSPGNIGSIFTIDGKNNNSLGTVRRNSCQVVWHAGNLEVADNLPTPHAHT